MILFCGWHCERDVRRAGEYRQALTRNCACRWIERVHLVIEDSLEAFRLVQRDQAILAHPKVIPEPFVTRFTYADYFRLAASVAPGKICIVANSDIAFDDSIERLGVIRWERTLVCLSRTEPDGSEPEWKPGDHWADNSQDVWAFMAPLEPLPRRCDWRLGTEGCDNVLAHEAAAAGLRLLNPWHDVKAWHVHASGLRRAKVRRDGRPDGEHALVPRCHLPRCGAGAY